MDEIKFVVGANLLNAIGEYLSQRPYREVLPMMNGLAQLRPEAPAAAAGDQAQPGEQTGVEASTAS